jgi:beta-aspartyl-dipeptidase (metallo-type)
LHLRERLCGWRGSGEAAILDGMKEKHEAMFTVIRGGEVYAPEPLGKADILLAGGKIARVGGEIDRKKLEATGLGCDVVDAEGCVVLPGFIDPHQHVLGAGGEAGPASRMPEIAVEEILRAGMTTVVGILGTDATTRHLTSLLAKARGLEEQGITTYIYTGNFQVPPPTFTGSVRDDIVVIDKVIGVGEIAIADFRSSKPTVEELGRIVSDAVVGGTMSGKAGLAHFHTGAGKEKLGLLHALLDRYDIPAKNLHATHITRSHELIEDAVALAKRGAYVDMDTIDPDFGPSFKYYREHGGPLDRLTVSSDAGAGTSKGPHTFYEAFVDAVRVHGLAIEEILPCFTLNTATVLNLPQKGRLKEGADADVLVLRKDGLEIVNLFAMGKRLIGD